MTAGPTVEEDAVTAAVCNMAAEDIVGNDAGYELTLDADWTFMGIGVGRSADAVPSN